MSGSLFNWTFLKMAQSWTSALEAPSAWERSMSHKYALAESKIPFHSTAANGTLKLSSSIPPVSCMLDAGAASQLSVPRKETWRRVKDGPCVCGFFLLLKPVNSFKHASSEEHPSARWEFDCFSSSPWKKNPHQTWYKLPLNWRRMEMHIMFNTLHFFLAALFWRLSEKPPTWTPFISARLNIQIKKKTKKRRTQQDAAAIVCPCRLCIHPEW